MASDFGGIFGPVVGGYLLDRTGTFEVPFFAGGVLMILCVLLLLRMPETLPRP